MTKNLFAKPQTVSDAEMAFGGRIKDLLPAMSAIPEEFHQGSNKWSRVVSTWFFKGLKGATFVPKPGIDQATALRHVGAIMGSFEPKHEHKTAGCAYLLSLWFESITLPEAK